MKKEHIEGKGENYANWEILDIFLLCLTSFLIILPSDLPHNKMGEMNSSFNFFFSFWRILTMNCVLFGRGINKEVIKIKIRLKIVSFSVLLKLKFGYSQILFINKIKI